MLIRRFKRRRLRIFFVLRRAGVDELEERVFHELLFDALLQLQPGELEDLHRLDHLRRLDESLIEAGRLV